ncbi:MAG: cytochrome-c peroxidase [Saprospiraceae bacterium]|nr:MAG: cytochrome-c peroxidase [Saprospiraceae bacterium]
MDCTDCPDQDIIVGPYEPVSYSLEIPEWINAQPIIPTDNALTVDGIELGRHLFYDPILSSDSTQACASCHIQEKAFTDGLNVSKGVLGMTGRRSSMSIVNMAYNNDGFFWDGRAESLEAQALLPVEDHLELNESWENVVEKLRRHPDYPQLFRKAFGLEKKSEITKELAVKAIAQFERTLLSFDSKYDQVVWRNDGEFTEEEEMGKSLFFFEQSQLVNHPGCSHCHNNGDRFFTNNKYFNNGIEDVDDLTAFPDYGRGEVTNSVYDNGKFRAPSLRNIELTAPYMHDGRFQTLEEVIAHYMSGGHGVENEDSNIKMFPLTEDEQAAMIAFLKTLTDEQFIQNPAFSNPFE